MFTDAMFVAFIINNDTVSFKYLLILFSVTFADSRALQRTQVTVDYKNFN